MSFTFIIPVVNPKNSKVKNYDHVEIVLRKTLESICRQSFKPIYIVVVCHRVPTWSKDLGPNIFFLNVSASNVFDSDANHVIIDKGLKYVIGILYALNHLNSKWIMPMDADDYVNVNLANFIAKNDAYLPWIDGYIIDQGLQAEVGVPDEGKLTYKNVFRIKNFHLSCGSCRIFKRKTVINKLATIHPEIFLKSKFMSFGSHANTINVSPRFIDWLEGCSKQDYNQVSHIVNLLGRHIKQKRYFNFIPLPMLGAAKACGHGNHDGPKEGNIHQDKILTSLSLKDFYNDFGIYENNPISRKKTIFSLNFSLYAKAVHNTLKYYLSSVL
jgi:hypothetical protein